MGGKVPIITRFIQNLPNIEERQGLRITCLLVFKYHPSYNKMEIKLKFASACFAFENLDFIGGIAKFSGRKRIIFFFR
jgi:hypothetical protein